ncbi:MAG: hypothetical protein ACOYON_03365 [Fimbriimonas sp.]
MRLNTIVVLATLGLAAVGTAQTIDAFDYRLANIQVLQDKKVQADMGVTEAQRNRMNEFAKAFDQSATAYMEELKKEGKDPRTMPQPDPKVLGFMNKLKAGVLGELSPAQVRRLREVSLQRLGLIGILDPEVGKRAGVPTETLKKMQAVYTQGRDAATKIQRDTLEATLKPYRTVKPKDAADQDRLQNEVRGKMQAANLKIRPTVKKIEEDTQKKLLALLTTKQRDTYVNMQGKPVRGK